MGFRAEPPAGAAGASTAVLLINLGTPQAPTAAAVRAYLGEFLADPRVVEIPKPLWWLILHGIILRVRPAKSALKYASIWTAEGSPLLVGTERTAKRLHGFLGERGHRVQVRAAMRYGQPAVPAVLDELKAAGAQRILLLPLYPQYAAATTASALDAVAAWSLRARVLPELRAVAQYHDDPGYIQALADSVRAHWQREGHGDKLVMSFHGLPDRSRALGDPYHDQCHASARLLARALGLDDGQWLLTFQSRFGRAKWLQPYTEPEVVRLAREGVQRVDLVCPGFATDCLETLEEINQEVRHAFLSAGGSAFSYIPCLNDGDGWLRALTDLTVRHLQGWPTGDTGQ